LASFFRRGKLKLGFFPMSDEKPLKIADGDGTILFNPPAFPLAWMSAGIGEDTRKGKRLPHEGKSFFELTLRDEGHIALSVAMQRTGGCTGRRAPAIDGIFEGDGLGEGDIDGLSLPESHIEFVWKRYRALSHAVCTGRTFGRIDIARLSSDGDFEMTGLTLDVDHFGIGEEVDVGMVGRVHHLGGDDASRAIEGGKGLVELCHVAADGWVFLHQMDFESFIGNIEGSLHPCNAGADDEGFWDNVSEFVCFHWFYLPDRQLLQNPKSEVV
jgi:hypothetical protein